MLIFAVGWGLDQRRVEGIRTEVVRCAAVYPHLDVSTFQTRLTVPGSIVASIRTSDSVSSPRSYVHESDGALTLFDGLPIDPTRSIRAFEADALDAGWDRLTERLEGRFCVIRVRDRPMEIELLTDPLGIEQVFVYEAEGASIVSNSAALIERVVGASGFDPVGVSTFLTLEHPGGDHTLREAIRVIPGGQHWTWRQGGQHWVRRSYFSILDQPIAPTRPVDEGLVQDTYRDLAAFCESAASVTGRLNAPITGGRDSRLLAAVLVAAGIPADFWTKGDPATSDVQIAIAVASRLGVDHRIANRPTEVAATTLPTAKIASEWDLLSVEFVSQVDGQASLIHLGNIVGQPERIDRLAVTLAGLCGEVARDAYTQPYMFEPNATTALVKAELPWILMGPPRGLVTALARRTAVDHVTSIVDDAAERGVPNANLPAAYYVENRCRRWAAYNPRELAQTEDKVLPFLTRQFVLNAMSIEPEARWLQELHQRTMDALVPGLADDPPFDIPWLVAVEWPSRLDRLRRRTIGAIPLEPRARLVGLRDAVRRPATPRAATTPYDEPAWVTANLGSIRDLCLADPQSDLWAFIDRRTLERLLTDKDGADAARRILQRPLFAAITMFQYEQLAR